MLHALQRVTGQGLVLVDVKTDLSRRVLGLPSIVAAALCVHRDRQTLDRMLAGTRWRDTGFVFTTRRGTPLTAPRSRIVSSADAAGRAPAHAVL